jgi:3'-phosphoadenosine 5'-phosphosulfate sulfotransferase (PAPS reductase)/FAD synthetase
VPQGRTICWFSCGAASAVAAKLMLNEISDALVVYCDTGAEHDDNKRFMADCANWLGVEIKTIKSPNFSSTWEVWEKRKYLASPFGAPCTSELKVAPRLDFQLPSDTHVFGYTADGGDVRRANRMLETYTDMKQRHPLIERGITKSACLAMLQTAGIEPPITYQMGFPNANCIPCVKATSPSYWALVRKEAPVEFERMRELSRRLNVRLAQLKGERVFIDEIPLDHPTTSPIAPACDFLCHMAEQEMEGNDNGTAQ